MEMFTRYNFPMTQDGKKPLFEWRLESEISKTSPNWYYVQHVSTAEDTSKRPTFGSSHKECPTNGPKAKAGCVWNRKQQKWEFRKQLTENMKEKKRRRRKTNDTVATVVLFGLFFK